MIRQDTLQLKVVVDTKQGINNLAYLEEEYKKLGEARRSAQSVEQEKALIVAQDNVRKKIQEQRDELGLFGKTARQIQSLIRDLGADLKDLIPNSDKAKEFRAELERIRQVQKGGNDEAERKQQEIDTLRLMIKDAGTASLSLKQLEEVSKSMHSTMVAGAKSGRIEEHHLYEEWVDVTGAIKKGKEALDQNRVAQTSYDRELKKTVETQGKEALSVLHLREYYQLLKQEIAETSDFESEANKKRIEDAQKTKALIEKREKEVEGTTSFFSQIKAQLPSAVAGAFGGMFVGIGTELASSLMGAISSAIDKIKKQARDVTDIQVALQTSRENAQAIKSNLSNIKTESTLEDLKKLVEVAGDLNVETGKVKEFVKEADVLGVTLSKDFNGSVEDTVTQVSKLKGEFRETRDMDFPEALRKIGSTLKVANLDGAASTQGITDFLKRVGAIPDAIKPTLPQLAALGSVFEEANLSAEISGSGYSKILTVAANNASLFAKQMRMSKQEIENLINTNPNEFVIKFAESLKGLSGTDTAKTLKSVKLESDEVLKVVGVLTDNVEKLTDRQELLNDAYIDGSATTKIFNQYLNDEAGQISQIEKAWARVTSGFVTWLTKVSGPVILALAGIVEKGESASEVFEKQKQQTESLNSMLPSLVKKYEILSLKTEKSAEDQERLNIAMQNIANIVPDAVSQYDDFGRVLKINLGIVNDFLEKKNLLMKQTKNAAIFERNTANNALGGERKAIIEELRLGEKAYISDRRNGIVEMKKLTDDEVREHYRRLKEINATLVANKKRVSEYSDEVDFTAEPVDPKKITKKGNVVDAKLKSGRKKGSGISDEKYLQEASKQRIELQAKLAFEEMQATADDEQKRINIANKTAEDEIKRVESQFKNKQGIVLKESELSKEQKDLIHRERLLIERKQENEVVNIYDEFEKKRQAQIIEQSNRVLVIAQNSKANELSERLRLAEKEHDSFAVFNAKSAIIDNRESTELISAEAKYKKEFEVLKDNLEAQKLLTQNYQSDITAIVTKYIAERNKLLDETAEHDKERAKKAKLESLQLDIDEAKQHHDSTISAQYKLLAAQQENELSSKELTEAEKTNIVRKYSLLRAGIEKEQLEAVIQESLQAFGQAFSGITNVFKGQLQIRETAENENYNTSVARIDEQEKAGTISKAKATADKIKIEKAHKKEIAKINYEQAKLDKANNIVQATVNGIQAVMKSYSTLGPIGGSIAAVVMGGITLASIAQIANAPLPKPEGSFFDGGAMPEQFKNPVDNKGGGLIIAHPEEYVVPRWIRQQPIFANIEPMIENMRRSGKSYEVGGAIGNNTVSTPQNYLTYSPNSQPDKLMYQLLEKNLETLKQLQISLQNIEVVVGYEASEKILDTANQIKSIKQSAKI